MSTFNVTIGNHRQYVVIAVLFVIIKVSSIPFLCASPVVCWFSLVFYLGGLLVFFSVLFRLLTLCGLYVLWRCLVCGFTEVYVCHSLPVAVYSKLKGI